MRSRAIILILVFMFLKPAEALAIEAESIKKYNEVIDTIYRRIVEAKEHYPELAAFSEGAVTTAPDGSKEISFTHKPLGDDQGDPYGFNFSLKAVPLDEVTDASAEWKFNLLGLKVILDSSRSGQLVTFDPYEIIDANIEELYSFGQDVLPFRLEVSSDKEVYTTREPITLTVTLRNLGDQPFRVLELNDRSLLCRIDEMKWGSFSPKGAPEKVLPPFGTLTKVLRVRGITEPKEARISCRYGVGLQGVQPFGRAQVRIQSAL